MYWVFDLETRSHVSVVDRGLAAHAADKDTDILTVCALPVYDDGSYGEVLTWRGAFADGETPHLTDEWDHMEPFLCHIEDGGYVVAHNEAYDRTVWNCQADKYGLPELQVDQMICSAAWFRQFNMPSKLGDVSKRLLLPEKAKLTDVASGIKYLWSKKNPLVSVEDVRANDVYCAQDVTSVADLMRLTPPPTKQFLDEYHACARMNDRGVCVDLDMARAAQELKPLVERQLIQRIERLCGPDVRLRGPSFLKWLQANLPEDLLDLLTVNKKKRVGYEFKTEKKQSADKSVRSKLLAAIEDRTDCGNIREAIHAFDEANRAAVGKYKAMLKVEHNGVVHNQFVFSGAAQTGRASSHGIQLQNTIRNVPKNAEEIIELVKEFQRRPHILETKLDMTINDALGRVVRPTLMAAKGNMLSYSDWSAIEARMLPWLSGDPDAEPLLDLFRQNGDVYVREAAGIFKMDESRILDGVAEGDPEFKEMRQVGKVAILACIAEGEQVLTHNGLRAIEDVRDDDLLWDGLDWVAHSGVVFQGVKEVMEYDGVVATPDHIVFTTDGEMRLDAAAESGASIFRTGCEPARRRNPPRFARTFDILDAGPRNRFTVGGKLVHNCGYQGGVGAFQAMAKGYGLKVTDERADEIKTAWREANPWAPRLWSDMESAAMRAVRRPGEIQPAGRMQYLFSPGLLGGTLLLFMPSGRFLAYPEAGIAQVTKFDKPVDSLVFRHPEYGPSSTYGGALVENATQGEAASLLRAALVECDKAGLNSIAQVHDEILIEHPISEIKERTEKLVEIMEKPPEWADGLPLDADAETGFRYKVEIDI